MVLWLLSYKNNMWKKGRKKLNREKKNIHDYKEVEETTRYGSEGGGNNESSRRCYVS